MERFASESKAERPAGAFGRMIVDSGLRAQPGHVESLQGGARLAPAKIYCQCGLRPKLTRQCQFLAEPPVGVEPTTPALQERCSGR